MRKIILVLIIVLATLCFCSESNPAYASGDTAGSIDIGIVEILSPSSSYFLNGSEKVTIKIYNASSVPVSGFELTLTINPNKIYLETYHDTIQPGAHVNYTYLNFIDLSNSKTTFTITACVNAVGDSNPDNNCISKEVENTSVNYCFASGGGLEYIWGVKFENVSNTNSGETGYSFYSKKVPDLTPGTYYNIEVINGYPFPSDDLAIWIDTNQDGDFDDSEERVTCEINNGADGTYRFQLPYTSQKGYTRLRIRLLWEAESCPDPCGGSSSGEVEDYLIHVGETIASPTQKNYLTVRVLDQNLMPIENAEIKSSADNLTSHFTDANGLFVYKVENGGYSIKVLKDTYLEQNSWVNVFKNDTVSTYYLARDNKVNIFLINEKFEPIEGASITFDDQNKRSGTTDISGKAVFYLPLGHFNYIIIKSGYVDAYGALDIQVNDFSYKITMTDTSKVSINTLDASQLKIKPNPALNFLQIETKNSYICSITDIKGNTIICQKIEPGINILKVNQLNPGIYFISLKNGKEILTRKFLKE